MIKRYLILGSVMLIVCQLAVSKTLTIQQGESATMGFHVEEIAKGLGVPWGMAFLSPSEILYTERAGNIGLLTLTTGTVTKITGGPTVG